jgi:flavorubredoxin
MTPGPLHLAGDAWLVRSLPELTPTDGSREPVRVHANAMVLAGGEPVLVDTGPVADRAGYWGQVEAVVDPADVRWVVLSHDDADHRGALADVLGRCPGATVVAGHRLVHRLTLEGGLPAERVRWVEDGDVVDAGDRPLLAVRPPAYDSPTTRGVFDATTGVYWGADCFGTPVPAEIDDVADLDDDVWVEGFTAFHLLLSPWIRDVDPIRWRQAVGRIATLGATTIASAHGPVIRGPQVGRALDLAFGLAGASMPASAERWSAPWAGRNGNRAGTARI